MPTNTAARVVMNDALGTVIGFLSLHTAEPNIDSGSNEVSGGSPAYARLAASWDAASGNTVELDGAVGPFNVPESTTVAYVGFWSLVTGGVFYGYAPVTSEAFSAQGEYTVTAGTHTLSTPA